MAPTVELTIDSLSYFGGRGVGRVDGVVVFVPQTAPGDRIRARITHRKPRFLEAEVVEILEKSPARREPPCPVAKVCGGCSWQHVKYETQVEAKEKILRDSLRALEKINPINWRSFCSAPEEFFYRNRVQVHVDKSGYGFFAKRSRDLVPIEQCWIAEPKINERMKHLKPLSGGGSRRVELALTMQGEVVESEGAHDPETALFGQVNSAQNEVLKNLLIAAMPTDPDWIMDLYSGAGNLTLPLHRKFPKAPITAIEYSREAIKRARARHPEQNIEWLDGDVGKVLSGLKPKEGKGVVVLDPPRVGCDEQALEQVIRHRPAVIVYVSCNPSTFARDAQRFAQKAGYLTRTAQGLDMFPQTEHVELIATLWG